MRQQKSGKGVSMEQPRKQSKYENKCTKLWNFVMIYVRFYIFMHESSVMLNARALRIFRILLPLVVLILGILLQCSLRQHI